MRFASLGSGSEGNGLLVSASSGSKCTTVLLDCGFALRETERRLARLDVSPSDVTAILVTHEHQDHVGGVFKFARRHRIPVWLSSGTFAAVERHAADVELRFCRDHEPFVVDALEITPYTVPHDAREPLQYVLTDGQRRLGVLTDAGHVTAHMIRALARCHALLLECNHDRKMLAESAYPPSLKQRIGGAYGHLSNESAAEILAAADKSCLRLVVAAHLSKQNNTPELALAALRSANTASALDIHVACQEQGFDWLIID